jgi:hypothetical protein
VSDGKDSDHSPLLLGSTTLGYFFTTVLPLRLEELDDDEIDLRK